MTQTGLNGIFFQRDHLPVSNFEFRSRAAQALAPRVVICLKFGISDLPAALWWVYPDQVFAVR